jgi:hypothetical protein
VIGDPPVLVGAVQVTVAAALPGAAVTPVGAPGAVTDVVVAPVTTRSSNDAPSFFVPNPTRPLVNDESVVEATKAPPRKTRTPVP